MTLTSTDRYPLPPYEELPPIITLSTIGKFIDSDGEFATTRAAFSPPETGPDPAYWDRVRTQFDLVSGLTFLNNGTYCPPPRLVLEAQKRWQRHLAGHPYESQPQALIEHVRARTATFVNASPDEIVLTRSTTEGINLLAQGLDWHQGDEILLDRYDHFTAFQSFLTLTGRYGVKLVFVDLGPEPGSTDEIIARYEAAITPRTRVLFLNHVSYRSGRQLPIKALAELGHRHDLLVSVDAAQSFGAVKVDVAELGVDHLVAPSHKWILAGPGAGFAFFSKRIIERVWPTAGPASVPGTPPEWTTTARKLDHHGPKNIATLAGFLEALEFHDTIGGPVFRGRLLELSEQLRNGLAQLPWGQVITPSAIEQTSALTTLHVGEDRSADAVADALLKRAQIKVNSEAFTQLNGIRISPHIYTTPAQIDYLLTELRKL